jgi:hypothetical protein
MVAKDKPGSLGIEIVGRLTCTSLAQSLNVEWTFELSHVEEMGMLLHARELSKHRDSDLSCIAWALSYENCKSSYRMGCDERYILLSLEETIHVLVERYSL